MSRELCYKDVGVSIILEILEAKPPHEERNSKHYGPFGRNSSGSSISPLRKLWSACCLAESSTSGTPGTGGTDTCCNEET